MPYQDTDRHGQQEGSSDKDRGGAGRELVVQHTGAPESRTQHGGWRDERRRKPVKQRRDTVSGKLRKERRRGKHVALRAYLLSTEEVKRFSPRQRNPAAPTMPPILRADMGFACPRKQTRTARRLGSESNEASD